jgi:hypothetical protein
MKDDDRDPLPAFAPAVGAELIVILVIFIAAIVHFETIRPLIAKLLP